MERGEIAMLKISFPDYQLLNEIIEKRPIKDRPYIRQLYTEYFYKDLSQVEYMTCPTDFPEFEENYSKGFIRHNHIIDHHFLLYPIIPRDIFFDHSTNTMQN
jgi:hypothetical protein